MTHTNHREGSMESLSKDYVVFIFGARGINNKDIKAKLETFLRLAFKCGAVNAGTGPGANSGNMFTSTPDELIKRLSTANSVFSVFDDKKKAQDLVKESAKADLGLSVVVSGLFKEVEDICLEAGIRRHTALCSLGVWGKVEKLPEQNVRDVTTMCGHSMVAANLVRQMGAKVKKGLINLEDAACLLAKPCVCGVFNPKRAEEILGRYIEGEGGK